MRPRRHRLRGSRQRHGAVSASAAVSTATAESRPPPHRHAEATSARGARSTQEDAPQRKRGRPSTTRGSAQPGDRGPRVDASTPPNQTGSGPSGTIGRRKLRAPVPRGHIAKGTVTEFINDVLVATEGAEGIRYSAVKAAHDHSCAGCDRHLCLAAARRALAELRRQGSAHEVKRAEGVVADLEHVLRLLAEGYEEG